MYQETYELITDGLVKKGYILIEDALDVKLTQNLLQFAKEIKNYKRAGISNASELHIDSTKRSDKTHWVDGDNSLTSEYLTFCDGLRHYLNQSLYLGLNYYESHFAIYENGAFYEKHLDAFKGSKNRVVTTVLYLNEEWKEEDGGELLIYDENDNKINKVVPKLGTLVVFLSDKFPHEVLPAKRKRYSIAGWFRVDKKLV